MTDRQKLKSIRRLLADYYNAAEIRQWLDSPHTRFGGKTPQQMIDAGKLDAVLTNLRQLDDAVYL